MTVSTMLPGCRRGHGIRTDVARESADIILIGSDLPKFVETLRVARRCHGIIMQNFLGTLLVDRIALAAFGFLIQWWPPSFASPLNWVSSSTPQLPALAKAGE